MANQIWCPCNPAESLLSSGRVTGLSKLQPSRPLLVAPAALSPQISTATAIWTLQSRTDTASTEEAFLFCLEMGMALSGKCQDRLQTLPRTGLPTSTAMACPTSSLEQIFFSVPEPFC